MIVDGRMQYLFDETGRRYLDLFGGIVTVSCGHCHPTIVPGSRSSGAPPARHDDHLIQPALPEACRQDAPGSRRHLFVNSGSEASDLAITMARLYTGHTDVIAVRNGYHGARRPRWG
jgi:alanine-glyoxylate transaminase/(R)-3-amino-2-methylpropionate-pyruvate transaminase